VLLHLALFAVGAVSGLVNVVAGGGSFLTLPMLIFMGLPATVANATNRVGVVVQNVGAAWGFQRYRVLHWGWALRSSLPAALGAIAGTWAALAVSDQAFETLLALLMIGITLWSLLRRAPAVVDRRREREHPGGIVLTLSFFLIGVYGGFVQAGVGFLILAATTFAGLDLVRGNAIKVVNILVFTGLSLAIFASQGVVDWAAGATLAAGNLLGAAIGVRVAVLKGHAWLRGVVAATAVVFAVLLLVR
jgi:uncharacterized protein